MASFFRHLRTPLVAGLAVWLFSFPLTTTRAAHASLNHPLLAAAVASGPSTDDRPNPT